jgi:hypothetical protein
MWICTNIAAVASTSSGARLGPVSGSLKVATLEGKPGNTSACRGEHEQQ